MEYGNKNIAVLGCGASGEAAAALLGKRGAMVTILDSAERDTILQRIKYLERLGVKVLAGAEAEADASLYDRAVVSPGIPRSSPLVRNLLARRIEMIGEIEMAYELCHAPVIAVTGTNGKTTTTGLVDAMLAGAGFGTVAGGNMGPPFSALIDQGGRPDYAVIEVSSFQLEEIRQFHPRVAVWLNFAPDHLDRYAAIGEYRQAKMRIFENQTEGDFAVVHAKSGPGPLRARTLTFAAEADGADITLRDGVIHFLGDPVLGVAETRLRGAHNAENLMAALGVGHCLGVSWERLLPGLKAFRPAAHRNEIVCESGGVLYINDSKATNPSALEMALRSQDRPVVLIAGGKDKGFRFDGVTGAVAGKVRRAVLIGQIADLLEEAWGGVVDCRRASSLEEAVVMASVEAKPGETVLLSPGTSSFDMFKSYEERGDVFRKSVQSITQANQ